MSVIICALVTNVIKLFILLSCDLLCFYVSALMENSINTLLWNHDFPGANQIIFQLKNTMLKGAPGTFPFLNTNSLPEW